MIVEKLKWYVGHLNSLIVIFTVLVFILLLKLGFWQLERATEKELRLARIEQLTTLAPLTLDKVIELSASMRDINDLPVIVEGHFNNDRLFLLDNQTNAGRLGYRILQVLESQEYSVLVNLGFISGSIHRSELPFIPAIEGKQRFKGNVRLVEQGIVLAAPNYDEVNWPFRIQQIDLPAFSKLIREDLLPFVIYVDSDLALGFEKSWQPIVMPPKKHNAYAFQWFCLAFTWVMLMISASIWFSVNTQNKGK